MVFFPQNATDPASLGLAGILGPNQAVPAHHLICRRGLTFGDERNFPQGRGDTALKSADTVELYSRQTFVQVWRGSSVTSVTTTSTETPAS